MIRKNALLIRNQNLTGGIYAMTLSEPDLAAAARPGQFLMVSAGGGEGLFLRRPFSFAGIDEGAGTVMVIYQTVGKGTNQMAGWEAGRRVDILGPLGNGFSTDKKAFRAILAGGGMGIAPLLPLAEELRHSGKDVLVFAGARRMDLLFGLDRFRECGCRVQTATEDGSVGAKGFITQPLEEYLRAESARRADTADGCGLAPANVCMLYACGPLPFLRSVAGLCGTYRQEAQISLEERMGCGFGACAGCSLQVKSAADTILQKRVCRDGPVFAAGEVVFHG